MLYNLPGVLVSLPSAAFPLWVQQAKGVSSFSAILQAPHSCGKLVLPSKPIPQRVSSVNKDGAAQ